jgi:hypothetical protein
MAIHADAKLPHVENTFIQEQDAGYHVFIAEIGCLVNSAGLVLIDTDKKNLANNGGNNQKNYPLSNGHAVLLPRLDRESSS